MNDYTKLAEELSQLITDDKNLRTRKSNFVKKLTDKVKNAENKNELITIEALYALYKQGCA